MNWVKAPFDNLAEVHKSLTDRVNAHIKNGDFTQTNVEYLDSYKLKLLDKTLNLSERQLELLRAVAKQFDVQQRSSSFTSHRPIIGPIIVAFKRLLAPFIRALLGDTIKQQRDFNAAVVDLLIEMGKEK